MRLGYIALGRGAGVLGNGFNEAEAHAPRIRLDDLCTGGTGAGFNEAEAHAPRIQIWN